MRSEETRKQLSRYLRKADQHWAMAELARVDGDSADSTKHTRLAKEWQTKAKILWEEDDV